MLQNTPFDKLPINEYEWMLAGVTFAIFVVRSQYLYHKSGNALLPYLARTWFFWGLGTAAYTIPLLFTANQEILRDTTLLADLFMYTGFLMQARLLWNLMLKRYFRFAYILIPYLFLIAAMTYINHAVATVTVSNGLVGWNESPVASVMYGYLILVTILPFSWYFLRQAIMAQVWKARLKAFMYFFAYTIIAITQGISSIFQDRADTQTSAEIMIVIFSLLSISVIWSSLRPSDGSTV